MPAKLLVFKLFPIISLIAFSYFFSAFINNSHYGYFLASIFCGVIFLALFVIQIILSNSFKKEIIWIFIESIALVIFFYHYLSYWILVAVGSAFLMFLIAYWRGRKELANMLTIMFFDLRKVILGRAIMGLVLFCVLVYISTVDLKTFVISKTFFQYFSAPIETVTKYFITDFSLEMPVGGLFEKIAQKAITPEVKAYTEELQRQYLQKAITNLSDSIKELTEVRVNLQDKVIDALYEISNFQLKRIPENIQIPVLLITGALIFLFITGFSFFFGWIIIIISWLIFKLLLLTNFITINYQNKQAEFVRL